MRKIITIILFLIMTAVVLSSCGNSEINVTVQNKYANSIADSLAADKTTDGGNTSYTFSKDQYIDYVSKLYEQIKSEFRAVVADYATYSYLNSSGTELVIGLEDTAYDETMCKDHAQKLGEIALKYNMSMLNPSGRLIVIYENCFTGKTYFKISITP